MRIRKVAVGVLLGIGSLLGPMGCSRAVLDGVSIGVTDGLSDGIATLVADLIGSASGGGG